ncbi:hypothetical protein V5799_025790 [Amblyomma americanum]|uniref:Uncharacterized protein n=1 Tax=Amblyomma americanum TaxID=6943 RepID=A0AAQ4E8A5_AMBAM
MVRISSLTTYSPNPPPPFFFLLHICPTVILASVVLWGSALAATPGAVRLLRLHRAPLNAGLWLRCPFFGL